MKLLFSEAKIPGPPPPGTRFRPNRKRGASLFPAEIGNGIPSNLKSPNRESGGMGIGGSRPGSAWESPREGPQLSPPGWKTLAGPCQWRLLGSASVTPRSDINRKAPSDGPRPHSGMGVARRASEPAVPLSFHCKISGPCWRRSASCVEMAQPTRRMASRSTGGRWRAKQRRSACASRQADGLLLR